MLTLVFGVVFSWPLFSEEPAQGEVVVLEWFSAQCGPYLQNPSTNGMSVLWDTEKSGLSWVEYWLADEPDKRNVVQDSRYGLRRLKTKKHHVELKGLEPGKKYAYKVYSRAKQKGADVIVPSMGDVASDGSFMTLDFDKAQTKVFIVNDMHGRGEEYAKLMEQGKANECDLIVHNGDIVDWISDEKAMYEKVLNPLRPYIANVPLVFVRGNHEYRGSMATDIVGFFPPSREGNYYGLLRQGPVCFVIMDTGEDKADDRKELGGTTDWESYFDEQKGWLEKAVEQPEFKSARYRVVVQHIPLTKRNGFTEQKIREQWVPIFNKAGIDLLIGAHTHRNMLIESGDEEVNFPVLVNDNKGYVTVDADENRLLIEQFDKEGSKLRDLELKR